MDGGVESTTASIVMKSQAAHPHEEHVAKRQRRLSSSPENHDDSLVVTGSSSTTTSLLSSNSSLLNDDGRVTTASSTSLELLSAVYESSISPCPSIKPCSSTESSGQPLLHDKCHGSSTLKDAGNNLNQTENVEDGWGEDVDDVDDFYDDFGETGFGYDNTDDDMNLGTIITINEQILDGRNMSDQMTLPGFQTAKQVLAKEEEVVTISAPGKVLTAGNNGDEYLGKWTDNRYVVMAVTSDDVSNPTLPSMPITILLKIIQYVDGNPDTCYSPCCLGKKSLRFHPYHPDILAFERTCRSFRHLLRDDAIWGTLFPDYFRGKHFDHPPTMRDKTFLGASLRGIRKYQKSPDNILLEYLGGAVGVRRIVSLLLDEMNPLGDQAWGDSLSLRGDAIEYLAEVIQGHMIARLQKVNLLVIGNLRPGDGYPEVREKDLRQLDALTLLDGESAFERCSIAHNRHVCRKMAALHGEIWWTWPDHNCTSKEILGAEERLKMVRALAYRAGIVKMSGSAFSIVATEVLHHMAVIVSYACDTFESADNGLPADTVADEDDDSNADYSDQCDDIHLDKGIQRGLNYYANFHPPGQTELVVIPRQIRDAAVMIGMKPLLGFGVFGAEWAASSDDGKHEEVEIAEDQYYPADEIEVEDERIGGDGRAIVPAPGPGELPVPDPDVDNESVLSLLSDSFSLDS